MPLAKLTSVNENVAWAAWIIRENEEVLLKLAKNYPLPLEELDEISHEQKRLEWLAGKICLAKLMENYDLKFNGIFKDLSGKPHLNQQNAFISLTHAFPYACAIFNTKEKVGIDIELQKEKILRIAKRYMSADELLLCANDVFKSNCVWTAKEVMYKAIGVKGVTFSQDLSVKPLTADWDYLSGHAFVDGKLYDFRLKTYLMEKHVICISY